MVHDTEGKSFSRFSFKKPLEFIPINAPESSILELWKQVIVDSLLVGLSRRGFPLPPVERQINQIHKLFNVTFLDPEACLMLNRSHNGSKLDLCFCLGHHLKPAQ